MKRQEHDKVNKLILWFPHDLPFPLYILPLAHDPSKTTYTNDAGFLNLLYSFGNNSSLGFTNWSIQMV